jgi:O-antigen/teichoic acid export membrane protein
MGFPILYLSLFRYICKNTTSLKKKFITNLILLIILNLLVKPFWIFGIDRTVQNRVGAGEYGLYFSLFSLSVLLNILLDAGLTNFNNRAVSRDQKLVHSYIPNIVTIKLALAFLYAAVCIILAFALQYDMRQFSLLMILCLNQFISSLVMYLRSNISGLQHYTTDSLLSVLDRLLMIILCGTVLWTNVAGGEFKIEWFGWLQTISYGLSAIIIFIIVLSKTGKIQWKTDFHSFSKILVSSLPFATLIFLMACYSRIDSVMIERMLPDGKQQAGIYAQAFRILDAAAMLGFLFAGLLLPMFSNLLKKNEEVGSLLYLAYSLIIIPAVTVSFLAFLYGDMAMIILYKSVDATKIFGMLMMGFVGFSTTYIFGTLLTANGSLKALNIMAVSALVFNVVLNLLLIPRYGALGAAIASASTQIATGIAQVFLSYRYVQLKSDWIYFYKLSALVLILLLSSYMLNHLGIKWMKGTAILCSAALISAFVLDLIPIRKIKDFKSEFDSIKMK